MIPCVGVTPRETILRQLENINYSYSNTNN